MAGGGAAGPGTVSQAAERRKQLQGTGVRTGGGCRPNSHNNTRPLPNLLLLPDNSLSRLRRLTIAEMVLVEFMEVPVAPWTLIRCDRNANVSIAVNQVISLGIVHVGVNVKFEQWK